MAFPGIGQHDGLEMASWIVGSEAQEGVWDGEEGQNQEHRGCHGGVGSGAEWEEQVTQVCSDEHLRTPWHRKGNPWLRRSSCRERRKKTRTLGSQSL